MLVLLFVADVVVHATPSQCATLPLAAAAQMSLAETADIWLICVPSAGLTTQWPATRCTVSLFGIGSAAHTSVVEIASTAGHNDVLTPVLTEDQVVPFQ